MAFRRAVERSRGLQRFLLQFRQAVIVQGAYTVAASSQHSTEVRLARWLLMANDRLDSDAVCLTHEHLAALLGVRRPSVTIALHMLEGNRFIRATRGLVRIIDRAALEAFTGDAYGKPEAEYARLLAPCAA